LTAAASAAARDAVAGGHGNDDYTALAEWVAGRERQ
jgi:hypothetical protein